MLKYTRRRVALVDFLIFAHKYKSARNREGGIRRNEENILQAADPLRLSFSLALRTWEVNEKAIFTGEPNLTYRNFYNL